MIGLDASLQDEQSAAVELCHRHLPDSNDEPRTRSLVGANDEVAFEDEEDVDSGVHDRAFLAVRSNVARRRFEVWPATRSGVISIPLRAASAVAPWVPLTRGTVWP